MQTVRIFFSASNQIPATIVEKDGPVLHVDLAPMRRHYHRLGGPHVKKLEEFMLYWEEEGYSLLAPRARIASIDADAVKDVLPPMALDDLGDFDALVLSVWTLGDALERESSRIMARKGSMMKGIFLDVAGSIALYDIHNLLLDWLAKEPAYGRKHVVGEFYPGFEGDPHPLMQRIEELAETPRWLNVETHGSPMFHPRKTQCAFVLLHEEKRAFRRRLLPCHPCEGRRCLYYQLGGCHLGIIKGSGDAFPFEEE